MRDFLFNRFSLIIFEVIIKVTMTVECHRMHTEGPVSSSGESPMHT